MRYRKKLLWLIVVSTCVRIMISSIPELGNAEVYYWVYSLHLQWNYFDHPPMVAWLIRFTTLNNALHNELSVRAGALLCAGVCTYIIFRIGETISNQQTGWYAAILYTTCYYSSLAVGAFILPDSPEMVFWLAGLLVLVRILRLPDGSREQHVLWCLFGLISGLCVMSKMHGLFLWLGVFLYAVFIHRSWLKNPWIFLSAFLTGITISPILIWNLHQHFVTFAFHGSRISLQGHGINFPRFLKQMGGIILICNPVNFFLICSGLKAVASGRLKDKQEDTALILFCSLPLLLMVIVISAFREIYPHWPGPALGTLLILPALVYSRKSENDPVVFPAAFIWAPGCLLVLITAQISMELFYPGTLSKEKNILAGKNDPTLDAYEWKDAGQHFDSLYKSDITHKIMKPGSPLIITKWYPAAHLDFYFGHLTKQETVGLGSMQDLHQYYWLNDQKKPLNKSDNAYYVIPSNLFDYKVFDKVVSSFNSYDMPLTLEQYRSGVLCRQIYIFRMKGYRGIDR